MLLAIDVGNSNIVFALFEQAADARILQQFRLETVRTRPGDEYAALLTQLFQLHGLDRSAVHGVVVASVVPSLTPVMQQVSQRLFGVQALVVHADINLGITVDVDEPSLVGVDRLVNAAAAFAKVQHATIVIDMGTATTFDCVSKTGAFVGGAICPGVGVGAEALATRAARLPKIEVAAPPTAIGRNTLHAMQSGIVLGYAAMVDGLVARTAAELGAAPHVIATGGFSALLAPLTSNIHAVEPDLTLQGLRLIYLRNR